MLIVGYFSQTSPSAWVALLITLVTVAFGIQIATAVLRNSSEQVEGAKPAPRRRTVMALASVVGLIAVALFAYASYTLLAFAHYFSLAAIGAALCSVIVACISIRAANYSALQN
ncbi:hypothetical protein P4U43_08895 [Arthrobacter sp. EH-1B-1]|uniref:Integral membrane protein n=1 Tax=Arthrobacter vasquezii TaxID=2977629 RepID=A0ABT6CXW8_9MICC|nr:hypothetical protein [Arthrobacter vasquezii]MDF9277904.1 hypothetical protein [Arthrobacter vasquezii]